MIRRNAIGDTEHYVQSAREQTINGTEHARTTSLAAKTPRINNPLNQSSTPRHKPTSSLSSTTSTPKSPRSHSLTKPCTYHDNSSSTFTPPSSSLPRLRHNHIPKSTPKIPPSTSPTISTNHTPRPQNTTNTHTTADTKPASTAPAAPTSPPNGNEATTKLAEALDDFLGDVERKFKGISDEVLARLDEMAERCDRLEAELLRGEIGRGLAGIGAGGASASSSTLNSAAGSNTALAVEGST